MPSFKVRREGAVMLHPLCPGGRGSPQKTVPLPWQTRRNFPERFPPLFTLHVISVFVQRVPNVTGLLCGVRQPPATHPPARTGGAEAWAALPAADPRGQHARLPQPCQILPRDH